MVIDGLKAYVQLASGLTDVTRERALAAARTLVAQGEAGVGSVLPDTMRMQVANVTDDLIATSKANRDLLVGLVRAEVERTVSRMGLVSAAELNAATRRAEALDRVMTLIDGRHGWPCLPCLVGSCCDRRRYRSMCAGRCGR